MLPRYSYFGTEKLMILGLHLVQKFNIKSFAVSYGMTVTLQTMFSIMLLLRSL
jgi:hypothetical protein